MKKELILLAALALPIQAQQPTPPSQVLTTMAAAGAKAPAATPAERAKALPALAKLPKDTGDFIYLTESASQILLSSLLPQGDEAATMPTSAAVASSEKNAPLYVAMGKLSAMCITCQLLNLSDISGFASAEGTAPAAKKQLAQLAADLDKEAAEIAKSLAGKKLHPVYIIMTFAEAPVSGPQPENGMTLDSLLRDVKSVIEAGTSTHPGLDALQAEAAKHQFSVKETINGKTRIICICEKGTEPKFAAKPEDSVLSTPKMARTDAALGGNLMAAGYISPELQTAVGKTYLFYESVSARLTAVMVGVADAPATQGIAESTLKASAASQRWLKAFIGPDAKKPGSFQVWTDKKPGVCHVTIEMDAHGCSYTGGLMHTKAADGKNTFLYIESTGLKRPQPLPDISTILEPYSELVAQGYEYNASSADMAGDDGEDAGDAADGGAMDVAGPEWGSPFAMFASALPMVGDLGAIGKGLGDGFAIIGDFAAKGKDKKTPFPRLAYACKISDMAQVTKGWEQLAEHAGALLPGGLDVSSKTGKDGATCHRLKLPVNEGDFVPNALTDGKSLILGTSIKLNKSMLAERKPGKGGSFKGAVFMLNMDKLGKGLKAASTDPESGIPPVDASFSGGVKSIFGTSTISDGVHTIQVDINLR